MIWKFLTRYEESEESDDDDAFDEEDDDDDDGVFNYFQKFHIESIKVSFYFWFYINFGTKSRWSSFFVPHFASFFKNIFH